MDNRKRRRLDVSLGASDINAGIGADGASLRLGHSAGTQSIFLSSDATVTNSTEAAGVLPTNVFLTICGDETSDDSQGFLTIDSDTLAHIKQEQDLLVAGNTLISSSTQSTQTLPLEYRLVNQLQRQLPTHIDSISSSDSNGALSSALSPMQLPSGCEIYLVKEYGDSVEQILTEENELLQSVPSTTTIKIEPDSCATSAVMTAAGMSTGSASARRNNNVGGDNVQLVHNTLPCVFTTKLAAPNATSIVTTAATTTVTADTSATSNEVHNGGGGGGTKRSYILEAYKKRDDKRRATHNEVERRRRDKINSWIFKLKEMLPTDMPQPVNNSNSVVATSTTNNTMVAHNEQRFTNINSNNNCSSNNNTSSSRPPPSDSKSQILIKACEYIKAMQDEVKSLRECLTENESLRLSNQRLQSELNKLRNERAYVVSPFTSNKTFNNNFNITLNRLNSSCDADGSNGSNNNANRNSNSPGGISFCTGNSFAAATMNANSFNRRELIIRDYVD